MKNEEQLTKEETPQPNGCLSIIITLVTLASFIFALKVLFF